MRLSLEAERERGESDLAGRRAELHRAAAEQEVRERSLGWRESGLAELYRLWGRRRHAEVERLRAAHDACRSERDEWAAARDAWRRAAEQAAAERQALTAQALGLEQARQELLDVVDRP